MNTDFDEATERVSFDAWRISQVGYVCDEAKCDCCLRHWQGWLARARLAHDENARLREFARDVIREHQLETEGIQELAVAHGLLAPVEATERCGEDCACAEYADFPCTCYRFTDALAPKEGKDEQG